MNNNIFFAGADPRVSGSSSLQLPTAPQLLLLLAATLWQLAALPTNTQTP